MAQYLISVYRPNGFDHSTSLDAVARRSIDALNEEMNAAGAIIFVGGLRPTTAARHFTLQPDDSLVAQDGAYLAADSYIDGYWVLTCRDFNDALEWGRKAALACRASVEVRPFY